MLRGCQNQCLEGSHMKIHKYKNTQIHKYTNTQIHFGRKVKIGMTCAILRFVLSKDTNNISPLVLWTDLIARKLVGETYHFSSRFISRTRIGPGEKVIFKIFQHPMLWGVYPEVLMALAQNSWQIWNSSNRLGDKSLHLFLKEPVRKRSQSCWAIDPYGWPSKKNCTTISGMLGGIFWPMRLAGTRSEHPETVVFRFLLKP